MIKQEQGFTLVELMITMVVFVLVMAASSQIFVVLLNQFKQQNKMAEMHIEGAIGLNILRRDLEHAGYGLPWDLNGATYREAEVDNSTTWTDRDMNDGPPDNPNRGLCPSPPNPPAACDANGSSNPPSGVRSLNNDINAFNRSDVLAIKSSNVAMNNTSQGWTTLGAGDVKTAGLSGEVLQNTDRVIVLSPANKTRTLQVDAGVNWYTTYNTTAAFAPPATSVGDTNVIYGIKPQDADDYMGNRPRMPFNRADYYIRRPAAGMPPGCAPNTGILYKSMLNHKDGTHTEYPVLNCAADMQVVYNVNGVGWTDDTSNFTTAALRNNLIEVRVYILAQEGQKDLNYTHTVSADDKFMCGGSDTKIYVGDRNVGGGRCFDFTAINANYRWKLYNLVVQPSNLRAQ